MEERVKICQHILDKVKDLAAREELILPPLRAVNHEIPLVNLNLVIRHRLAKCPELLREELRAKIDRYLILIKAGWWEHTTLPSSVPLLVVFKKNGAIQTVIDARQRNDNTLADFTPVTTVYMPLSFWLYLNFLELSLSLFVPLYPCYYGLTNIVEPSFIIICFSYSHVNDFTCLQFHMLSIITCYSISHVYYYLLCTMYL